MKVMGAMEEEKGVMRVMKVMGEMEEMGRQCDKHCNNY
jgi:hypothetical protein